MPQLPPVGTPGDENPMDTIVDSEVLPAAKSLVHCQLEFPNKSAVARTLASKFSEIYV